MKKILMILFILPFIFASCSDNEPKLENEKPISFTLNKKSVDILYNDEETLSVMVENLDFDDIDYEVRDTFVASAHYGGRNKITIRTNHIGETFLVLSYKNMKDSCKIIVTPTDMIIEEPNVLNFGVDKATVKREETNNLLNESENSLRYEIDKYNSISYYFVNDKLDVIYRWGGSFTWNHSRNILKEMYELIKADNGILYRKGNLWIKLTRSSQPSLSGTYYSEIYYSDDSKKLAKYKD